jgi:glycosyltransferase involved in cell wall biosynthesis
LIIINDASTNDIEKVIKEYEKKDERVVYVKNEKNLKLTKTLNK